MKLTLSLVRGLPGTPETTLSVAGDVLTVDGAAYDLSAVPEGGRGQPQSDDHPFIGAITRAGGVIHCAVRVHLGDDAAAIQPDDPAGWTIDAPSGPVPIPARRNEEAPE